MAMMNRKKRGDTPSTDINKLKYRAALEGTELPPLTLDNKWHQLLSTISTTPTIERLSVQLNELIKRQGQLYNDIKDIRAVKQKLMDTILNDMTAASETDSLDRVMEERSRLVDECTLKIEEYQKEYNEIPNRINDINYQLMVETMDLCHRQMKRNITEIAEIDEWVERTRAELKKQLVIKEDDLVINNNLYTYLHDIFGSKIMEIFDVEYDSYSKVLKNK